MDLVGNKLFLGVNEELAQNLYSSLKIKREQFNKGQIAFRFSSSNNKIGYVVSGKAEIIKCNAQGNQTLLETLPSHSLFGNLFAYAHKDNEYVVVCAKTDLIIDYIPQSELMKSCGESCDCRHKFITNVLCLIGEKTAMLGERVEVISNRTIREKLLCYFSIQSSKCGSNEFKLQISLTELAEYISVDRTAMMRELKRLKEDDILIIKDKKVKLQV